MLKKSNLIIGAFALVFSVFYTSACTKDKLPEPMAGDECLTLDATYNGAVKAIIDETCAVSGCHVAGGGSPGNFSDFAGLEPFLNDAPNGFRDRVIVLRTDASSGMPPDYAAASPINLTDEQLEIVKCWADAGYPEQ